MPSIKGTASISSCSAQVKLLRSTKFPPIFHRKVDARRINVVVMTKWIEERIEAILGFEDEIVSRMAVNLFLPHRKNEDGSTVPGNIGGSINYSMGICVNGDGTMDIDPRRAQLDLAGFLGENEASLFASELWEMLLDAQMQPDGVPKVLVQRMNSDLERKKKQYQFSRSKLCDDNIRVESGRSGTMGKFIMEAERRAEVARKTLAVNSYENKSQPVTKQSAFLSAQVEIEEKRLLPPSKDVYQNTSVFTSTSRNEAENSVDKQHSYRKQYSDVVVCNEYNNFFSCQQKLCEHSRSKSPIRYRKKKRRGESRRLR